MPFISVIVTAHNRREYLRDAVDSVLNQTIDDYEIIVVKNFKDEIDDYLKENSVKSVLVGEEMCGMDIVNGLREARGEVISFLDDDDLFLPRKLEKVKEVFQDEEVGYYHNAFENFLERTPNNLDKIHIKKDYDYTIIDNQEKVKKFGFMLSKDARINNSSISIRKTLITNSISYLEKIDYSIDMFMFYLGLISNKKMIVDPCVLSLRRIHYTNSSVLNNTNIIEWIKGKKNFKEHHINDFIILHNMARNTAYERNIRTELANDKITLARLPSIPIDKKYRPTLEDLYYYFKLNKKSLRAILSGISIYAPDFVKWKLIRKLYDLEQRRLKEKIERGNKLFYK
ncbi:glycosyltransferase family 2 protein [Acidianus brierleyi]|uniref:Glycosyltransferase 2-like domain-containing protein n=1 Tax=Acidianus brierleyi TaxID=41673 RepID=A0A2U9IDF2_9CREN|nr:glycosyltransferase family 2 protein [Acidianus brierleyi]AWR93974.1 glycosyltransferase [Acidianus brierleyi]